MSLYNHIAKWSKWIVRSSFATVPLAAIGAFYHRPVPDLTGGSWGGPNHHRHKIPTDKELDVPTFSAHAKQWRQWLTSKRKVISKKEPKQEEDYNHLQNTECIYADDRGSKPRTFLSLLSSSGRYLATLYVQAIINFVIHVGMNYYNEFKVVKNCNYDNLINTIRSRETNVGLITVSNHGSTIDDPTLFGSMLPFDLAMNPSKLRWTLCSQEICFKHPAVAALLGAGNVLPIRRGGGVDQPLLLNLAHKVAQGGWVHMFPEGKIFSRQFVLLVAWSCCDGRETPPSGGSSWPRKTAVPLLQQVVEASRPVGNSINWKPTAGRRRSKTVRGVIMPDVFRTGEGTRGLMSFRPNT